MASQLSEEIGNFTPTIKNTFLTLEFMPTHVAPRSSSVPRCARLCQDAHPSMCDSKLLVVDTDASTYETDSESGTRTPMSFEDLSPAWSYVSPQEVNVYPQHSGFIDGAAGKLMSQWFFDVSAQETDSESGTRTPMSFEGLSAIASYVQPQEVSVYPQNLWFTPTPPLQEAPPPQPHSQLRRLNTKADPYLPQDAVEFHESSNDFCQRIIAERCLNSTVAVFQAGKKSIAEERLSPKVAAFQQHEVARVHDTHHQHYRKNIAEVIRLTKVLVKQSEHVKDVEVSEEEGSWSVTIQPKVIEENSWQTQLLVTLAKQALLDAATKSKCIYVLGYCDPQPFSVSVQGFQATLCVMQNAATACWHIFKKGFCRHGDNCCKQHPACQVPIRVVVEGVQLKPCAFFASMFKVQAADLALTVTEALGEAPEVESVEAFKDKDSQGWTIELTAKEDVAVNKDHLLSLAKNALFGATGDSDLLYVIGYATKPFVQKSAGFVVFVGDMQDESKVCWDMYSKGLCSRGCACRFQHPECLMPINVVVKEMSHALLPFCAR